MNELTIKQIINKLRCIFSRLVKLEQRTFEQVNADWDATTGPEEILNKPDLSLKADLVDGIVPSSQLPSYVPLTGTENGSPITGDIHIEHEDNSKSIYFLETTTPAYNTISSTKLGLQLIGEDDNNSSQIDLFPSIGIRIYANSSSKGLFGMEDYSPQYDEFTYVQKKYVDAQKPYKVYIGTVQQTSNVAAPTVPFEFENQIGISNTYVEDGTGLYHIVTNIPDTETGKFIIPGHSNRQPYPLFNGGSGFLGQYIISIGSSGGFVTIILETTDLSGLSTSLFDIIGPSTITLPEVRYYPNSSY